MLTLRLALAGIRHRWVGSLLILLLVTTSVGAAVFAAAYTRAVEQWALADTLRSAPASTTTLTLDSPWDSGYLREPGESVTGAAKVLPVAEFYAPPVSELRLDGALRYAGDVIGREAPDKGRLVYRQGQCERLVLTVGHCPAAKGELIAAADANLKVGQKLVLSTADGVATEGTVTGLYTVADPADVYWAPHTYFDAAPAFGRDPANYGTLFASEAQLRSAQPAAPTTRPNTGKKPGHTLVDYALRPDRVNLDNLDRLLGALHQRVPVSSSDPTAGIIVISNLSNVALQVTDQRATVVRVVLFVAVQLVALCWLVLYLVLANVAATRSPEVAIAKLRGLGWRPVLRFGLAEALLPVLVAGPVGALLGWLLLRPWVRFQFGELGVLPEFRPAPVLAGLGAYLGVLLVAVLASAAPLRRPVNALLRRVASGLRRRFGALDAILAVIAGVALYALVAKGADDRLGLVAGSLVALSVAGLVGRVMALVARRRGPAGIRRGRPVRLLSWSGVGRRPGGTRTIALLTVATALLVYGLFSWGVAANNRALRAGFATGAATVYEVAPVRTDKLLAAVHAADPTGRAALAAVEMSNLYSDHQTRVLAVDAARLAAVGFWSERVTGLDVADAVRAVRPDSDTPIELRGPRIEVDLDVRTLEPANSMALVALVDGADGTRQTIRLGDLATGQHHYAADLPGCDRGCRFFGFNLFRRGGVASDATLRGDLVVTGFRDGTVDLSDRLRRADGWRGAEKQAEEVVATVSGGPEGMSARYEAAGTENLLMLHNDAAYPLPAVVSDPQYGADAFHGPGLYGGDQSYRAARRVPVIPGIGAGLLVDLSMADRAAGSADSAVILTPQVWASAGAPADLRDRLTAAGLKIVAVRRAGDKQAELDRQAPAKALGLYLFAALGALVLGVAGVPLTSRPGSSDRAYEVAALRVAGLSGRQVRRAVRREYSLLLGAGGIAGTVVGLVIGVLTLPYLLPAAGMVVAMPVDVLPPSIPAAGVLGVIVLAYGLVVFTAVRTTARRGVAQRLREGTS